MALHRKLHRIQYIDSDPLNVESDSCDICDSLYNGLRLAIVSPAERNR